jgi:hypothetical protein
MRARVVSLLIAAIAAPAASASLTTHAAVGYGSGPLIGPDLYGAATCSAQTSYTGAGSFSGSAVAQAAYGNVGAVATVEALNALYPLNRALGESSFLDTLQVNGPTGDGFIIYTYTLTGSAQGEADAHLFLRHSGDPDEELAGEVTSTSTFDSLPHHITFGQPFQTGLSLLVIASIAQGQSGQAFGDFSAGAALTSVRIFDAQMNPLQGWTIQSESGTAYPVPSPVTVVPLVLLGAQRRAHRSSPLVPH